MPPSFTSFVSGNQTKRPLKQHSPVPKSKANEPVNEKNSQQVPKNEMVFFLFLTLLISVLIGGGVAKKQPTKPQQQPQHNQSGSKIVNERRSMSKDHPSNYILFVVDVNSSV